VVAGIRPVGVTRVLPHPKDTVEGDAPPRASVDVLGIILGATCSAAACVTSAEAVAGTVAAAAATTVAVAVAWDDGAD